MSSVEKETLDEIIKRVDEKLELILVQTTRHNGRLTKTETWQTRASAIFGVYAAITSAVIIPMSLMLFNNYISK